MCKSRVRHTLGASGLRVSSDMNATRPRDTKISHMNSRGSVGAHAHILSRRLLCVSSKLPVLTSHLQNKLQESSGAPPCCYSSNAPKTMSVDNTITVSINHGTYLSTPLCLLTFPLQLLRSDPEEPHSCHI